VDGVEFFSTTTDDEADDEAEDEDPSQEDAAYTVMPPKVADGEMTA
jgi:hypothetical protein